jgi:hypothetical protein
MPLRGFRDLLLAAAPYGTLLALAQGQAVRATARSMRITCRADELQRAADQFRLERGLLSPDATASWLAARGLNGTAWRELLKTTVLQQKLEQAASIQEAVAARFAAAPQAYASAQVGVLTVEDEGIAQEIHLLLVEEGISFEVLARRYSLDFAWGDSAHPLSRRRIWRFQAPPALAAAAFRDDFRGPLDVRPMQVGQMWQVFRVYGLEGPVLDAETQALLRTVVVREKLRPAVVEALTAVLVEIGCPVPDDIEVIVDQAGALRHHHMLTHGLAARTADFLRPERA